MLKKDISVGMSLTYTPPYNQYPFSGSYPCVVRGFDEDIVIIEFCPQTYTYHHWLALLEELKPRDNNFI